MFKQLKEDLDSIMERAPAARSRLEVYLLYSGFKAVHRVFLPQGQLVLQTQYEVYCPLDFSAFTP